MKTDLSWKKRVKPVDGRRLICILQDQDEFVRASVNHFISIANEAIAANHRFFVALSGGSTPKILFNQLVKPEYRNEIDWSKVHVFWSDERCVAPTDIESNYRMAMDAGFASLPILPENIFRMHGEQKPVEAAEDYNEIINEQVPNGQFDLIMLGMGPDGHTASLFPGTEALSVKGKHAVANYVRQKDSWRLTLTFDCINAAKNTVFYASGESKSAMLKQVLSKNENPPLPAQRVGLEANPALWIVDALAAREIIEILS